MLDSGTVGRAGRLHSQVPDVESWVGGDGLSPRPGEGEVGRVELDGTAGPLLADVDGAVGAAAGITSAVIAKHLPGTCHGGCHRMAPEGAPPALPRGLGAVRRPLEE